MKTLIKLISLFDKTELRSGGNVLALVVFMAVLDTLGVASLLPFLAVVGDPDIVNQDPMFIWLFKASNYLNIYNVTDFIVLMGILSISTIVISAIYRMYTQWHMNNYIEDRRNSLSKRLLALYLAQPYEVISARNTSDLTKTLLSEVDQLVGGVLRPVINMFCLFDSCIFYGGFLLYVNPLMLGLSLFVLAGSYLIVFSIVKSQLDKVGRRRTDANTRRFLFAQESLNAIRELKLSGNADFYLNYFGEDSFRFARSTAANLTLTRIPKYVVEAIAFGGIVLLVLVFIVNEQGIDGDVLGKVLPMIGLFAFAAYRLQPSLQFIFAGISALRYGKTAVERIRSDLRTYSASAEIDQKNWEPIRPRESLQINISEFRYQVSDKSALQNISLSILPGQSIGIVGQTGSGKSTLINILLGLLRPTFGEIEVDGIVISDEKIPAWRSSIGYVPQDIFLADTSLAENIAFGVTRDQIDISRVHECAKVAEIFDFINADLDEGFWTQVGERGVRLSGGQKQRIGIARALYEDPSVLVLDEATSALDSIVEKSVISNIERLKGSKIVVMVAHRIATIRDCDSIIMLESGAVADVGTYEELHRRNERFRSMVNEAGRVE